MLVTLFLLSVHQGAKSYFSGTQGKNKLKSNVLKNAESKEALKVLVIEHWRKEENANCSMLYLTLQATHRFIFKFIDDTMKIRRHPYLGCHISRRHWFDHKLLVFKKRSRLYSGKPRILIVGKRRIWVQKEERILPRNYLLGIYTCKWREYTVSYYTN